MYTPAVLTVKVLFRRYLLHAMLQSVVNCYL
jgi:hypothetical protein